MQNSESRKAVYKGNPAKKIKDRPYKMKVSIITATMNSEQTVEQAIKSLIIQSYSNIEHIIIDGGSSDRTISIIKKYKENITKIISEKYNCIYYALNKGLEIATGDIVGFLHSDDQYFSSTVIDDVVKCFKDRNVDCVIGDLVFFKPDGNKIVRYYKGSSDPQLNFSYGIMPPHPSVFLKKNIYDQYGFFNTEYLIAADYDFLFRVIKINKIRTHYVEKIFVRMNLGGLSTKSLLHKLYLNYEILKVHLRYRVPINFFKKLFYRMNEYKVSSKT